MLTDQFIKGAFIKNTINKDLLLIRQRQIMIAKDGEYRHGQGGYQGSHRAPSQKKQMKNVLSSLSRNSYKVGGSGATPTFTSSLPKYVRFMDMKHLGNWRIYNAQIWGILYNNSYQSIKYGFTEAVRATISKQLSLQAGEMVAKL